MENGGVASPVYAGSSGEFRAKILQFVLPTPKTCYIERHVVGDAYRTDRYRWQFDYSMHLRKWFALFKGYFRRNRSCECLWTTPILMSHGVISKHGGLQTMHDLTVRDGANATMVSEWDNFTTSGYDEVVPHIQLAFHNEILRWRTNKIAATRCDWFGHSLGGVVAKWYFSDIPDLRPDTPRRLASGGTSLPPGIPPIAVPNFAWHQVGASNGDGTGTILFHRPDNFGVGECRRFISVGSPFQGSPVGDYVVAHVWYEDLLIAIFAAGGPLGTGNACAADDLGSGRYATGILKTMHPVVSWRPIVGQSAPGENRGNLVSADFGYLVTNSFFTVPNSVLPPAATSDCIVPMTSQVDGNTGAGFKSVTITSVVHTEELESAFVYSTLQLAEDLFYLPEQAAGVGNEGFTLCNPGF